MNNKVNFLRGTATEYESSIKDNDTFYYTTDTEKLYLGDKEITGGGVTIDDTLSDTSKNPVQNKVINAALNNKAELTDIPDKLPADGGNADTVDGKHASDFMQNLGYLTTGSLLDHVLTMTESGYLFVSGSVTDIPVSGQFFFVDVRRYASGHYAITATRFNAGGVWTNRYNASMAKWYGWANVADGGNAATVGGAAVVSSAALGLHRIASGTDEATTTNCPAGCWYGKHS